MVTANLTERQLATILAALRYWQREGKHAGGAEQAIASNDGELSPLSEREIDQLAEYLNA